MENLNNDIKNTNKPPVFILFLLISLVLILYLIYNIGLNFKPATIIEYKGYAVSGKELIENLLKNDLNAEQYIEAVKIDEDAVIYKKIATYFVGEEKKTKINLDYPIYINQNIALLNMSENSKLITTKFEEIDGYKNSTLTDGGLYNVQTLERADYNDYIFLKNSDNVFINSKEIKIQTNTNTYIIPKNSIINFTEEYIAYYSLQDGTFEYKALVDVALDSIVEIQELEYNRNIKENKMDVNTITNTYSYKELLKNLNLIKESAINKVKEESKEIEKKEEQEIKDNKNESQNNSDSAKIPWTKPVVSANNFEANVYTATTILSIYDPSEAIKKAINFEIYKNGKIYMRNQAVSSGNMRIGVLEPNTEYEIKGSYRYSDEEGKTIEVQFINQKITTKSIDKLNSISLSFEQGNIYSNKIELIKFLINSNLKDVNETLIGIKKGEIIIDGKRYDIKSSDLKRLLNGQEITYQSEEDLKSNSEVDFEVKFYDVVDNLVKIENNTGKVVTCKAKPEVKIEQIGKKNGIDISLEINQNNPDNVEIKNMNYVVYSVNNEIIDKGQVNEKVIKLNNIELARYYNVKIYGDYDLEDKKGELVQQLLGETAIATSKIEAFGELYIDLTNNTENLTANSNIIDFNINTTQNKTSLELVSMLKQVCIVVSSNNEVVQENYLNEQELDSLKRLETLNYKLDRLSSNTNYTVKIEGMISLGNTKRDLTAIINGPKNFKTLKQEAIVSINNLFILKDTIDFDINVYDKDNAIRISKVILEVITSRDEVVQREEINASADFNNYTRIKIQDLLKNEKYYLSLTTDGYSTRHEESTIKPKSFEFNGNEARIQSGKRNDENVGIVWTNNVGGDIQLESIGKVALENNNNLVDVSSNVNWYSECFNTNKGYEKQYSKENGVLKLGVGNFEVTNSSQIYVYDLKTALPTYNQEKLDISFKYKKSESTLKLYLQNGTDFSNDKVSEITTENSSFEENEWYVFNSRDIQTNITTQQYIGFLLEGNKNSYIEIKELQVKIHKSDDVTSEENQESENIDSYEEFLSQFVSKFRLNLNLYDESLKDLGYSTNITDGKYYIRINNITDNKVNDLLYLDYIEKAINDDGIDENLIENMLLNLNIEQNKKYEVMLFLKHPNIEEREYILNKIEFDTSSNEIKNIASIEDYLKIQPNGSYVFSKDINLNDGDYKFGNENIFFNGVLDFNGKTLNRKITLKEDSNYKYYLFYGISESGVIKNIYFNFNIDLRNAEGRTDVTIATDNSGLVYENRGTISNIIVNLASSTNSPNQKFAIIGHDNVGTLENFAIYLKANFYLGNNGALGFLNCTGGTIKNGYLAPYPNTTYSIKPVNCFDDKINIAALAAVTSNSKINSVYSLVNINNEEESINPNIREFNAGNLLARVEESTVKNVYSVDVGNITLQHSNNGVIGPTISCAYNIDNKNDIENSYFFYDENLNNNEYNTKVNTAALSNAEFQEKFLNADGSDKKFIINSTIKEYFPQVIMSNVMPLQLKIPMKKTLETEADVLLVKTLEDGNIEKLVEFTIYNPKEAKIDKIEIDGLEVDKYRIHSDEYCNESNPFEKCKGHDDEGYCLDENGNRILVEEDGYTQNYLSGQTTKLITKIRIPKEETKDSNGYDSRKYISKYPLKLIKAKGYEEKKYIEDDGTVNVKNEIDLVYYYQIKSIEEWKRINQYPDENYKILNNLEFGNNVYTDFCITNVFTGILNGEYEQGKSILISNIGKEGVEAKLPLFYKLDNANVCNINIDGFNQMVEQKNVQQDAYIVGLIGMTTKGTVLNNIHIKNANLITKTIKNNIDNFYIGGLVANAEGTIISNCSMSYSKHPNNNPNIYDFDENKLSQARVGGIVGYSRETEIFNCYTRNIAVKLNLGTSDGIGGIVGNFTGKITNCYATGQVKTNAQEIGGIFGRSIKVEKWVDKTWVKEPNICNNCYAAVNIKTDSINIGGIGGFLVESSLNEVENNISIGNLYTSMAGVNTNSNRVYGNIESTAHLSYAYKNQLINGFKVSPQDSNYNRGAKFVVDKEDLLNNYNTMFNSKIYNVEDLRNEYLPRLKYSESNSLLPNQEERENLPVNPVLEIISAKEENGKIRLDIKDENNPATDSNSINIELLNFNNVNIEKREYNELTRVHTLYITGQPIYYLDSYEVSKIMYKDSNNLEYSAEISVKIDYTQYKTISSVEEWVKEFCPEYSQYNYHKKENDGKPEFMVGQNYKIKGNIDFSEITNFNGENVKVPTKLEIGRLLGENIAEQDGRANFSNLTITTSSANFGIFRTISKEIKNINFKDINIKNTNVSFTGIITRCTAQQIENVNFSNIKVESLGAYVSMISDSTCTNINNVKLENITCIGSAYVAGFIARTYPGNITNISGNNINITATSSYVGGIFGYMYNYSASYGKNIKNLSVTNSNIECKYNNYYLGGIVGFGTILNNAKSENNVITTKGSYAGGIVGYQYYISGFAPTEFYVKDLKMIATNTSGTNIGGVTGYNGNTLNNVYVYGINITAAVKNYVGGISGTGAATTNAVVEGYVKDGINYNVINAPNTNYVGGIGGYLSSGSIKSFTKNLEILGNNYVGGIIGRGLVGTISYTYCQDCTVTGNNVVGGLVGTVCPDSYARTYGLQIYNTYNNAKVISNNETAGGLIGYMDNTKTTNQRYIYNIYYNIVAGTEITANNNAGSIIGKIDYPLYYLNSKTKYYFSNLIVSNIDENHPVGNIDTLQETYTVVDTQTQEENKVQRTVPVEETMSRLFNTLLYKYEIQGGKKVLEKEKLDNIKLEKTYRTNLAISSTYFDYTNNVITTKYPMLKTNYTINKSVQFLDGTSKTFAQTGILLPEEQTMLTMSFVRPLTLNRNVISTLPEYKVYTSDINKINIEFNNKSNDSYFKYEYNNTISKEIPIEKRVYTFEYDFMTPFKLIISNSDGEKEEVIEPSSISKKVGIINNKYYLIKGNFLSDNLNNTLDGKFVNIYGDLALSSDGYMYNIKNNSKGSKQTKLISLLNESKPLTEFIYNENSIETYYNFSKVISQESENITDFQMFIKNGKMFVLDGKLNIMADSVILDAYNNKEYQSVLGTDGVIYDLKEKLNYPEDFQNESILQMTNNLNSDKNEVLILYKDGRVYAFNYITGTVLYDSQNIKEKSNMNILGQVNEFFNITNNYLYKPLESGYKEALELQNMLTITPIEKAQISIFEENSSNAFENNIQQFSNQNSIADGDVKEKNINNNEQQNVNSSETENNNTSPSEKNDNKSYITVYDSSSNKYLVYKETTLLKNSTEKEEVISETEKINLSPELKKYYETANMVKAPNKTNGIYFVIISIGIVCGILVIMYKKKNYE